MAGLFGRIASAARRLWRRSSTPAAGRESSACFLKISEIAASAKEKSREGWLARVPTLAVLVYLGVTYNEKVQALKLEKYRNASLKEQNEKLKAKAAEAQVVTTKEGHTWWKILGFWK